jgi:putative cell wall-binding protein
MRIKVLGAIAAVITATVTCTIPVASADSSTQYTATVTRIAGGDRYATSVAVSQATWAAWSSSGTPGKAYAESAVLARGDGFADAIAGGPLAAYRHGPLLLTEPNSLDPGVRQEIARILRPGATVYVLGGTAAISPTVAATLTGMGYQVMRLAGPDRFATALDIAHRGLDNPADVIVTNAWNYPDALVATQVATSDGEVGGKPAAIVLSDGATLTGPTRDYVIAQERAWVSAANRVSPWPPANYPSGVYGAGDPAIQAVDNLPNPGLVHGVGIGGYLGRIGGSDRYVTALAAAYYFAGAAAYEKAPINGVVVASGASYGDALSCAAMAAALHEPMMLVAPDHLPADQPNQLTYHYVLGYLAYEGGMHSHPWTATFCGGPNAIDDTAEQEFTAVADNSQMPN